MLVSILVYSSPLKLEVTYSSETQVSTDYTALPAKGLLATCFMLISCLAYSSTLKMEAACSSKHQFTFNELHGIIISEDRILHNHCCKNLKPYSHGHVSYGLKNVLKMFSKYYSAINTYLAMESGLEWQCPMFAHGLY
jgi:hypothetical protein